MSTTSRTRSSDRRFYGVAMAIVVDNVDPKGQGRVRVRLLISGDPSPSAWCRVSRPSAGPDAGIVFTPELKDEVVVAFHHGDLQEPIILGVLHNGVDANPAPRTERSDRKLIRTRAGHELAFDDSPSGRKVEVRTGGGHELVLDDERRSVTLSSAGGGSVVVDDAAGSVTVSIGRVTATLTSDGRAEIRGATITLDAATVNLGGEGGEPLVKGSSFLALFNAHTHVCAGPGNPSSPPAPPGMMTAAQLTTKSRGI